MSGGNPIAIVTGASRGAGRGIARALGSHGCTVYITGRSDIEGTAEMIAFTSSPGAMHYCFGPAYGAHKAGVDKMAFDMGVDFADAGSNIAAVSIWMGALTTERLTDMMEAMPERFAHLEGTLETPDYTGHVAWAIYTDPNLKRFNGRTIIGADAGKEFGITDLAGKFPPSVRETTGAVPPAYYPHKVK